MALMKGGSQVVTYVHAQFQLGVLNVCMHLDLVPSTSVSKLTT